MNLNKNVAIKLLTLVLKNCIYKWITDISYKKYINTSHVVINLFFSAVTISCNKKCTMLQYQIHCTFYIKNELQIGIHGGKYATVFTILTILGIQVLYMRQSQYKNSEKAEKCQYQGLI